MSRIKIFEIDPKHIKAILEKDTRIINNNWLHSYQCVEGLPQGAEFRGFAHDYTRNCLNLFFEHDSFDDIPDSHCCPREYGVFKKTTKLDTIASMINDWPSIKSLNDTNWNQYITDTAEGLIAKSTDVPEKARIVVEVRIEHES